MVFRFEVFGIDDFCSRGGLFVLVVCCISLVLVTACCYYLFYVDGLFRFSLVWCLTF